ncbi:MAG: hypothetical protein EOO77_11255 [Oxalobacteraceae bacterium]|nr:MAG: hypothetical protein EOO77_11255 [Oxalobacteraceae bacterium]
MKFTIGALACALTIAVPAVQAQTGPIATAATTSGTLRAGTSVPLKMAEGLTTKGKKLKVGQRFQMETAEAVMIDGNVVIPAGSPVTGEITEVRNKGMWGKSGRINGRVLYVRANGRQIRMSGSIDDKGKTGTAGVVGAAVLIPVAGFFMTGTSADIPLGSPVTAFIDEDVSVAVVPAAAPMVVVAPAANALVPTKK